MESRKASRRLPGRLAPVGDGEGAQHLGELKLRELTARLKERRCFKVGDLIKWKPGLANRSFAEFGEPLEVMAILPTPIHDRRLGSRPAGRVHPRTRLGAGRGAAGAR